jgi:hypothetical protein
MGVRKGDQIHRRPLDEWLAKNRQKVDGLLREFGIPSAHPID